MTGTREQVTAINAKMVDDYWGGESIGSIAKRMKRSPNTVSKLVQADKKANGPRPRPRVRSTVRMISEKKEISPRHARIGFVVARYRAEHDLSLTDLGIKVETTRSTIRNMELGAHDFTLTELDLLAKIFQISFEDLIK